MQLLRCYADAETGLMRLIWMDVPGNLASGAAVTFCGDETKHGNMRSMGDHMHGDRGHAS